MLVHAALSILAFPCLLHADMDLTGVETSEYHAVPTPAVLPAVLPSGQMAQPKPKGTTHLEVASGAENEGAERAGHRHGKGRGPRGKKVKDVRKQLKVLKNENKKLRESVNKLKKEKRKRGGNNRKGSKRGPAKKPPTVTINTGHLPEKMSWRILKQKGRMTMCKSKPYTKWWSKMVEDVSRCKLKPGVSYVLQCKDKFGSGWAGGSITIQGVTYCGDDYKFNAGHSKNRVFVWKKLKKR